MVTWKQIDISDNVAVILSFGQNSILVSSEVTNENYNLKGGLRFGEFCFHCIYSHWCKNVHVWLAFSFPSKIISFVSYIGKNWKKIEWMCECVKLPIFSVNAGISNILQFSVFLSHHIIFRMSSKKIPRFLEIMKGNHSFSGPF